MATFTWTPTYSVNKSVTPRVNMSDFGDGYTQRAGDGLNTQRQIWDVEFISDSTTVDAIESFLENTGGYQSFDWTPPRQSAELKFRYTTYNRDAVGPFDDRLTATFRQEFDLV
jgi:phage-related protein